MPENKLMDISEPVIVCFESIHWQAGIIVQNSNYLIKASIILAGLYIAAQMLADIGSLKIVSFFGLALDGGTFIYPITFTLRDLVHKRLGKKSAQNIIFLAAFINIFMAVYFWLLGILPAEASWAQWDGVMASTNDAFVKILSPAWAIVIASIIAELVSELVDTEVYQLWTKKMGDKYQWSRVLISNAASVPLDSLIFAWLAFGIGLKLAPAAVWEIFWLNVIIKFSITLLSLPLIYTVREKK